MQEAIGYCGCGRRWAATSVGGDGLLAAATILVANLKVSDFGLGLGETRKRDLYSETKTTTFWFQ